MTTFTERKGPGLAKKKLLENPIVGAAVVPLAIILVGALVVVGVTKMLDSGHSHKDLVRTLQSKTFGNRWVAALELSKLIASEGIPESEIPWLLENLEDLYGSASGDPRTRNFIIVAAGALGDVRAVPLINRGLDAEDAGVRFHAVVALGRMEKGDFQWSKVIGFLESSDILLSQGAVLTLATHRVPEAEEKIALLLTHSNQKLRYSAAMGLINYRNPRAVPTLREILFSDSIDLDFQQRKALKINVLTLLGANAWSEQRALVQQVEREEKDLKVLAHAKEAARELSFGKQL